MNQNAPNLYELNGKHLHIIYSTSSIDGRPHLTYQDAHQTLTFKGDDIRTVPTEIGKLVTVSLRRTVDSGSTSFTILVPDVTLDQTNLAHVSTEGLTTLHRFSVVPAFNNGQKELYTVTPLHGTARFVLS